MTGTTTQRNKNKRPPAGPEEPEPASRKKRARNRHEEEEVAVELDGQRPATPPPPTASGDLPQKTTPAPPAPFTTGSPCVHLRILRKDITPITDTPLMRQAKVNIEQNWPGVPKLKDMPPGWPNCKDGKLSWEALLAPAGVRNPPEEEDVVNDEMEMDWVGTIDEQVEQSDSQVSENNWPPSRSPSPLPPPPPPPPWLSPSPSVETRPQAQRPGTHSQGSEAWRSRLVDLREPYPKSFMQLL
ncbi:hypothetical protein FPV67DRAFT_1677629 [Lyophyllum atratum]|nr:hypothetical protein FPV67DRAFT_1677629 [Lyophyllum atratum]